jgi:transcription initiation factor TFIIB
MRGAPEAEEVSCPKCGGKRLIRDYEHAEVICGDCGYVITDKLLDAGPDWRMMGRDKTKGRTGAPMTLSVDYSEPIVVEKEGEVRIVKIGEFVDSILENAESRRIGNAEIAEVQGYRTFAFDSDYRISLRPISSVSRHEVFEDLYEIELEAGRRIRVTGAHSLFGVKGEEIVPIKVEELKEGDFIVVPRSLPSPPTLQRLNLLERFARLPPHLLQGIYVHPSDPSVFAQLEGRIDPEILKNWRKRQTLPLQVATEFDGGLSGILSLTGRGHSLETTLDIDEQFCRLLGYYVSEGHVRHDYHGVGFSFGPHEGELARDVIETLRTKFNLNPVVERDDSEIRIEARSRLLSLLIAEVLGAGKEAHEKRVPWIVFSLPYRLQLEFLWAYVRGDGSLWVAEQSAGRRPIAQLHTVSVNESLSNDILLLYLQLGVFAGYNQEVIPARVMEKTKQFIRESLVTMTRVTNPDAIATLGFIPQPPARQRKAALEELIPAPQEYRRFWKNRSRKRISRCLAFSIAEKMGDEKLRKLAESPFAFLRVKKISRVKPSSKYAYDLSIPGCENFLCGRGWVFAHNSIHDKGLSTMIDWRDKDSYGKELTAGRRAQIYRLRKWQRRIRIGDAVDRNLTFALGEIERMTAHLGLPNDVKEAACHIYRKAVEERLIRGRSIEGVAAAALYAACRQWRIPRTLDEIAEVSRVSKKEIGRSYRFIIRQLMKTPSSSPVDYIPRFASELGLSGEVEAKAIEILKKAAPYGLTSGRGPTGVAAAALYIATVLCNERRTQREIANVARVTEVTVRNRYKEIAEKLRLDVELD